MPQIPIEKNGMHISHGSHMDSVYEEDLRVASTEADYRGDCGQSPRTNHKILYTSRSHTQQWTSLKEFSKLSLGCII